MKKVGMSAVVAMILSVLFVVFVAAALLGDADNDGRIKAGDARTILRHAAKVEIQTDEFILKLMDVDGNGSIKASDARLVLRMASRQETTQIYIEPSSVPGESTSGPAGTETDSGRQTTSGRQIVIVPDDSEIPSLDFEKI